MIEPAQEHDGQQIVAMTAAAGVFTAEEVEAVAEIWEDYRRFGPASGYHLVVAREGPRVLGYACFGPRELTEGTYDLYWIVTDIMARGRGIGHALIQYVEQEVRRIGGRILVVETSGTPAYTPTRRFYLSCGYTEEAHIRDFYHPGDDLVIYTKHLAPLSMPAAPVWTASMVATPG